MEEGLLRQYADERKSIRDISNLTGSSYTSVRYWLKKYDIRTNGLMGNFSWEKHLIEDAMKDAKCKSDILRNLGRTTRSGNFDTLERHCLIHGIDLSVVKYDNSRGNKYERTVESTDMFVENSLSTRKSIKTRLLKDGLMKYECSSCKNAGKWEGKELSLQLDHINGINNDNRIENLRFLCPNCHSQTDTFGAKNKKNKE